MLNGKTVIDVHGHMSAPPHFRAHAYNLVALRTPDSNIGLTPELMKGPLDRHLRLLDSHHIDLQLISPRPVAMMHWEQPYLVEAWTRGTNDVIAEQCRLHPARFAGIAQLDQNADLDTANCVAELERCIGELGFVGAILNPDPGGDRRTPGMNDRYWFPLYAKAEELNATLIVHPSISRDPRLGRSSRIPTSTTTSPKRRSPRSCSNTATSSTATPSCGSSSATAAARCAGCLSAGSRSTRSCTRTGSRIRRCKR